MAVDKQSTGFLLAFGTGEMIPYDGSQHFLLLGLEYYQKAIGSIWRADKSPAWNQARHCRATHSVAEESS